MDKQNCHFKRFLLRCPNPVDPQQVIFHRVLADDRVPYPSHFKRFEIQMFAFAEDKDNLSQQVKDLAKRTTFRRLRHEPVNTKA